MNLQGYTSANPQMAAKVGNQLKDGRWALLGNDIDDGRYKLNLLLSEDEGKTWQSKTILEDDISKKGSFSYPSLIQTEDSLLHLSYSHHPEKSRKSIKYVVIDPSKIK
jgi:predicted neuraminidase